MVTIAGDDWTLVAPWYRWELADGSKPDRSFHAAVPAFHKYATTDFVDDFLEDPQHSLAFDTTIDYSTPPEPGVRPGVLKLFQPLHSRHYLVAVELHCRQPGFPKVDPLKVAAAGFVVRRAPEGDDENGPAARMLSLDRVRDVANRRRQIGWDRARQLHPFRSEISGRVVDRGLAAGTALAVAELGARQVAVIDWTGEDTKHAGWVPSGEGSIGSWVPLDSKPQEIVESVYAMQPLPINPDDPDHAAREGTIFFGLVPTGSDEVTPAGRARFDADHDYFIQAFVRVEEADCPGELIWSEPSKPWRMAAFFDPVGSSQRPAEIAMPSLTELKQSMALPSLRITSPVGSSFDFKGGKGVPSGSNPLGAARVCFQSIPLITIVATFVLNVFMPIVIWLFQLWWMLGLKFCIPNPAGAAAIDQFLVNAGLGGIQGASGQDIDALLSIAERAQLEALLTTYFGGLYNDASDIINGNTLSELIDILTAQGQGLPGGGWPRFTQGLAYTQRVTREEVKEPWPP